MDLKRKSKKRKVIIIAIISLLVITLTGTYALWNYFKVGPNQQLVAGDIYLKYTSGTGNWNIENAMPSDTYNEKDKVEFTIEGKNTYKKDVWYEIVINRGEDSADRHTRLKDKYLKFRLTETKGDSSEEVVVEDGSFEDFSTGKSIWVNTIEAGTKDQVNIKYKLYVWISSDVQIGNTDGAIPMEEWNDTFASIKVTVNGDFEEKTEVPEIKLSSETGNIALNAKSKIKITASTNGTFEATAEQSEIATPTLSTEKGTETVLTVEGKQEGTTNININFKPDSKLYKETTVTYNISVDKKATSIIKATIETENGVIGVSNSNQKLEEENEDIREYRYSGLGVNNYVTFNDELWRILGVFKDENGQELVKIVRNEVLKRDVFPVEYTANGITYKIQSTDGGDSAYWNKKSDDTYNNDWAKGGLKYWLNSEGTADGYLKKLTSEAQEMIEETKWYLGNVTFYDGGHNGGDNDYNGIKETPIEAYANERSGKSCLSTSIDGCLGGYIWPNNEATCTGKIGLMYPSDYGYSASDNYWTIKLGYGTFNGSASETSWLQKDANHTGINEWFLSPSSTPDGLAAGWESAGHAYVNYVSYNYGIRPTLYLKSDVQITGAGTGESTSPYQLSCDTCRID